jgi:hypothetical protein
MADFENMEMNEQEARANALRQLIGLTKDDFSMASYAAMAGIDPAELPGMRRAWIAELRGLEGNAPTLEEVKAEAIMESRLILAQTLETPIEFSGKLYSVTLEKQNLLSAQLGLFGLNAQAGAPTPLTWNATGEPCEPWEFEQLLTLSNTIAAHVKPLAQMQRDAEVNINKAKNEKEVRNVLTKYADALDKAVNA